jgi:sulfite reductase beta subunit-like hemoprotein
MRPTDAQHREALAGHADRLRRHLAGRLPDTSWAPIRLGYGLYYQLDHTSHMQRIKLPGGLMTAAQVEALAEVAERWGRGIAHVTTRQDIQIHWVPVGEIMDMYELLHGAGITTRGACADSVRNVTACPYAGVAPDEAFDVAPYALAVHEYFLFNPLNLTLPRKFKIAVEGCPEDCAQIPVNDIGFYAKERDGRQGFGVWAGGGLGAQPFLSVPVADFVPADDILIWSEAIVRVQHRHAERKNRKRSRMKYVAKRLGADAFRALIEEQAAAVEAENGAALRAELREIVDEYRLPAAAAAPAVAAPSRPTFERWRRTNVRAQRQQDLWTVDIRVPLGDVTSHEMREVARLARAYGNGTVRTTNDQNLVMPSIPATALPALHAELEDLGLGDADVHTITDVVSCPGMDYCSLAITRSMGVAERIRQSLMRDPATGNGFAAELGTFSVKISGCPNACGQHHVGNIGLTGHNVTEEDGVQRPHYSILAGGSVGEGTGRIGMRVGRFPEAQTPGAIAALARLYAAERHPGETFPDFAERVGRDRLSEVAEAGAAGA